MRVLSATSGDGSSKGHSHHHHHPSPQIESTKVEVISTAVGPVSSSEGLRSRGKAQGEVAGVEGEAAEVEVGQTQKAANASLKLSAYLNLFGDFSECFAERYQVLQLTKLVRYPLSSQHYRWSCKPTVISAYWLRLLTFPSRLWLRRSMPVHSSVQFRPLRRSVMRFRMR
jgi:hypothetical protein